MRGRDAMRQVGSNAPCGLWQSVHWTTPSFTRCLKGMENCARTRAVAGVAQLGLSLGEQKFRRGGFVNRMAVGADHVLLGCGCCGGCSLAILSGRDSEGRRPGFCRGPVRRKRQWSPSRREPRRGPSRVRGSFRSRCFQAILFRKRRTLEMRIAIEIRPDVGMAGLTDIAADVVRRQRRGRG